VHALKDNTHKYTLIIYLATPLGVTLRPNIEESEEVKVLVYLATFRYSAKETIFCKRDIAKETIFCKRDI